MITTMTVTNHLDEELSIVLANPAPVGLAIASITGLGPAKATINSTESATADGAIFSSARLGKRNIVLTLAMLDTPSVEANRRKIYKYFPVKKRIKLSFEAGDRSAYIYGYVESVDPTIFQSTLCTAQVSIICTDPYFRDLKGNNATIFYGVQSAFEFPFSNESLTTPLLEMSIISDRKQANVYNSGEADTGMIISMHLTAEVSNISIYNVLTREFMKINTDKINTMLRSVLKNGDDIIINTNKGSKSVYLYRPDGSSYNILNSLERDSTWLQLSPGDNEILYMAETGEDNIEFEILNSILYEGI